MNYFRIHPYFGYIITPGIRVEEFLGEDRICGMTLAVDSNYDKNWLSVKSNSNGFFSNNDYPYSNNDEYVVGIFGGSVAQFFAVQRHISLANKIEWLGLSKRKKVKILNFSLAAFMQPQINYCYQYFITRRQKIDLALCINGFNDLALPGLNLAHNHALSMPAHQITERFQGNIFYESLNNELDTYENIVENFILHTNIFRAFSSFCGTKFLHILQPNQYYCGKTFSEYELERSIDLSSPYKPFIETLYPQLIAKLSDLYRDDPLHYLDATQVFDGTTDTIYCDSCCHYNIYGNSLLESAILNKLKNETYAIKSNEKQNVITKTVKKIMGNKNQQRDIYSSW